MLLNIQHISALFQAKNKKKNLCIISQSQISKIMSNLGVMLMWDKRVVEKLDCTIGVSCLFRSVEDGFDWVLRET